MPEDRRKRAVTGMSIGTATALRRSRHRLYVYAFVFLIYFPSTCWTGVAQKRRHVISFRPAKRRKVLLSFNAICYTTKCEAAVFPYRSDTWNNTETTGGGGVPVLIYTLDEIRRIVLPIAQKYRLPAVYLFGSYARGAAAEGASFRPWPEASRSGACGDDAGGFPSGQRGQTVNLLAMPTVVRIHPPPP